MSNSFLAALILNRWQSRRWRNNSGDQWTGSEVMLSVRAGEAPDGRIWAEQVQELRGSREEEPKSLMGPNLPGITWRLKVWQRPKLWSFLLLPPGPLTHALLHAHCPLSQTPLHGLTVSSGMKTHSSLLQAVYCVIFLIPQVKNNPFKKHTSYVC